MKTSLVYSLLGCAGLGALAHGGDDNNNDDDWRGWGGRHGGWDDFGPDCASSCFSSYWASATPTPTAICNASHDLASCVSSACPSATSAVSRFDSRISSACARLTSCTNSGTYTYTYGPGWRWDDDDNHHGSTRSGETTVTVTGCPWDGGPWGFWGDGHHGDDDGGWGNWGSGWKYTTRTETVTVTESNGGGVTPSNVVVGQAVSGTETRLTTFTDTAAAATTTANGNNTASSLGDLAGVKAMGACLAVALLAIALL